MKTIVKKNKLNHFITKICLAILLCAVAVSGYGCDENGGITIPSGATELTVSMKSDDAITDAITITEAKALITNIQYKRETGAHSQLHHTGPFVINFALGGSLTELLTGYIVRDKYINAQFQLHQPEETETVSDPDFKEGTGSNQRFSFIIKGTYNGTSFIYKTKKSMSLLVNMNAVSNINLKKQNITIAFNETLWFKNGSTELDPNDPNNAAVIDENIKNSFKLAFVDNNKDGQPD